MSDPALLPFEALLARVFEDPGAEAELQRRFGRPVAVAVVSFSGMATRSEREGIVYALALAAAAERVLEPAFSARDGTIVKRVADSLFVAFASPVSALLALLDAQRALAVFNAGRTGHLGDGSRREPIHACAGLGWGDALVVRAGAADGAPCTRRQRGPGRDVYGVEVNRAFTLGEDVARPRETLCTDAFFAAVGALPDGVGAHRAPEDRAREAGFGFHVIGDWRE